MGPLGGAHQPLVFQGCEGREPPTSQASNAWSCPCLNKPKTCRTQKACEANPKTMQNPRSRQDCLGRQSAKARKRPRKLQKHPEPQIKKLRLVVERFAFLFLTQSNAMQGHTSAFLFLTQSNATSLCSGKTIHIHGIWKKMDVSQATVFFVHGSTCAQRHVLS